MNTAIQNPSKTWKRSRVMVGFKRYHRIEVKDMQGTPLYHCDFIRCDHADQLARKLSAHPDFKG